MMQCPRCQHENRPQAKFCEECATPLARTCSQCGGQVSAAAKFCSECAHPVSQSVVPQQRLTSPQSYTPKHLAEKILTSKSALEDERKQVTVLFADLKGSMELLADRDPEEARKLLDPVLERMMEAVHRYEGTVNQVMGDGIMALFGAPIAHEDHAIRACYAALDMQAAILRYAEEVRRTHGVRVQIRVGLNSGEVVVRSIGSDLHMDYTAIGQTTHLAARMEQLADPGTILLTTETLRLAEGYVEVKPLGPVPVKGLDAPMDVYEIVGAGPARSRLHAAAARGFTRFVGRDAELEQLRHALSRATAGHGHVVAIVGEPGVGKSRLVWEVTPSHRTHGWLIVQAGSVSYGKATPYLPVIDLLKRYVQIDDRDGPRAVREKVIGKLLALDERLRPALPAFLSLLDVPVDDDATWSALDPPQRRQRTLEALKRLLLRESQVQPLLVIFEDLHWIDGETQAFLDSLVESLPPVRMLLLVNYRPEYAHRWGGKTYYTQLRLDPLPPESAEALLDVLAGSDPALRPLKDVLIERTEGNPFFLEESVRTLVETRVLAGKRGAYRLAQSLPTIQVPTTVQAVLAARIDRLAAEDKRLLQTAGVIGKDVPFPVLQAIAEAPEDVLRHSLATLQAGEFLRETRLFPDLEYTFKHALTHEVAYGGLLQDRRRALHARIVEAIEALYPDRLAEHVDRLAHHAFRGEVWEKAVPYLRRSGARAAERAAHRAAAACLEQALSALQRIPVTREVQEESIDVRIDLRLSYWLSGELEKLYLCLREAESLARALGDQRRLGWISNSLSHYFLVTGDSIHARTCAQSAQAIGEALGDVGLTATTNYYLGWACHTSGDFPGAEAYLRKAMQWGHEVVLQDDSSSTPPPMRTTLWRHGAPLRRISGATPLVPAGRDAILLSVASRWSLVVSLGERGAFHEGIAQAEEGVQLAEALDHAYSLVLAYWGLGHVCSLKGDLRRAEAMLARALALSRGWSFPFQSAYIGAQLGFVYALSERIVEGLSLVRQALADLESAGVAAFHSLVVAHLGQAYQLTDRFEDARAAAARALSLARERGERAREADALRLLGDVAAHRELLALETADGHYSQALALATDLGMRPLVAHCHLGLGKLYRRVGKREPAQEHLTTAATMYREMDMAFWLEKSEAEMRGLA
jgi:class 3 adenylate cyclase/tetratricopeptide (TPR) repeat protein